MTCGVSIRLHRLRRPFSSTTISPSAYFVLGTGHGRMCGIATTKKLAITVVANSDEVMRDLGCRCGGIVVKCGLLKSGCLLVRSHP